jgi:hypothetical protein
MDLQPSRNVGLENQLQAIQLGASLYDRAQTQKRMMEQLQVQTAESLLQRQGMELQNKIRSNAYAQALDEQANQAAEYDTFQKFNEDVGTYFNDPELKSPMPALPRFKSKVFNQEATRAYQGLQQYSPRAKIIKAREQFEKTRSDIITEMQNQGFDVFDPQTGQINEEVYQKNAPAIRQQMSEAKIIKDLGTEISEEVYQLDKNIPIEQRIKTARTNVEARRLGRPSQTEGMRQDIAVGALENWKELFGTPDKFTENDVKNRIMSNKWDLPTGDVAKEISGDYSTAQQSSALINELNRFDKMYGKGKIQNYVGIIDGRLGELKKRLNSAATNEEREAYSILQRFNTVFNSEAFATSGKAVTQPETVRLKSAIGDIRSKNFVNDANNFAKFAAENLYNIIDQYKTDYKISRERVKLANELVEKYNLPFTPFGKQQQSAPAPSSGGIKIISTEIIGQ